MMNEWTSRPIELDDARGSVFAGTTPLGYVCASGTWWLGTCVDHEWLVLHRGSATRRHKWVLLGHTRGSDENHPDFLVLYAIDTHQRVVQRCTLDPPRCTACGRSANIVREAAVHDKHLHLRLVHAGGRSCTSSEPLAPLLVKFLRWSETTRDRHGGAYHGGAYHGGAYHGGAYHGGAYHGADHGVRRGVYRVPLKTLVEQVEADLQ